MKLKYSVISLIIVVVLIIFMTNIPLKADIPLEYQPLTGVVIDAISREPIPDASIIIDCRSAQFHGTRSKSKEAVTTDQNGEYRHRPKSLLKTCSFIDVYVQKENYIFVPEVHVTYSQVAERKSGNDRYIGKKRSYMVKQNEYSLHKLNKIIGQFTGYGGTPGFGSYANPDFVSLERSTSPKQLEANYRSSFLKLMEAIEYADTPERAKLVAATFCKAILKNYEKLTEEQINRLRTRWHRLAISRAKSRSDKVSNHSSSETKVSNSNIKIHWEHKTYYLKIELANKWCESV